MSNISVDEGVNNGPREKALPEMAELNASVRLSVGWPCVKVAKVEAKLSNTGEAFGAWLCPKIDVDGATGELLNRPFENRGEI